VALPRFVTLLTLPALLALAGVCWARAPGDPIRLTWDEGDIGGMTTVYDPKHEAIGAVEYRQTRKGDRLSTIRITRFRDGSSDEDAADARVGETLEALGGHSVVRDRDGEPIVDLHIDVAAGRIAATWGRPPDRQSLDEPATLTSGTYWGPLVFIVLKNFDANAEDGRLVFRTVAPTPKPLMIDLELTRNHAEQIERTGLRYDAVTFRLSPTVHWIVDPIVRMVAPRATFWILPGAPPALVRFAGPRNYGRQEVVIE
jgi:hypothetical protein